MRISHNSLSNELRFTLFFLRFQSLLPDGDLTSTTPEVGSVAYVAAAKSLYVGTGSNGWEQVDMSP